jgi:hypothetical protein
VGSLGVSYDRLHDLVVLILVDARLLYGDLTDADLDETREPGQRLYTTRGQALLLSQQVARAVTAGRPTCPLCQEPIDDFGHFCLPATARNRRTGEFLH